MFWMTRFRVAVVFCCLCIVSNVNADKIEVTGYASLIGTKVDEKDLTYWNEYASNYADFTHQSHIGLQLNTEIVDDLEFSLTLLGKGKNSYISEFAWFYATYAINNDSAIRFGRLKVPFYMVSNYIDIGHAYPWITPPPEVYSTNVIESADGLEYIYETDLFDSTFLFNTYVGSHQSKHHLSASYINSGANTGGYKTGDKIEFEAHDLFGVEISFATDYVTFRASHNQAVFTSEKLNINRQRMNLGSFGLIIDIGNFILYTEMAHRFSDDGLQTVSPDQDSKYVTVGYKFSKFLTFVTLAELEKGKSKSIYAVSQESISLGFRYDVNPKMALKFQATEIEPGFESGDIGRFGLFDQAVAENKKPNVYSMSVDFLF